MGGVLGRLSMVFIGESHGGGEEETPGHVLMSRFFAGRDESPNRPFFMSYIIY